MRTFNFAHILLWFQGRFESFLKSILEIPGIFFGASWGPWHAAWITTWPQDEVAGSQRDEQERQDEPT